jgi:hypothetical protein
MLDYEKFSALRMRHLFTTRPTSGRSFYQEEGPDRRSYDEEYLGGRWDTETVDGVFLYYPKSGAGALGAVEAWASPEAEAMSVPGQPEPYQSSFIDAAWSANASVALAMLRLSIGIGGSEAAVRVLAAGPIKASPYPDGSRSVLYFTTPGESIYYLKALIHPSAGMLTLKIYRPDLVKANGSRAAWKYFESHWKKG